MKYFLFALALAISIAFLVVLAFRRSIKTPSFKEIVSSREAKEAYFTMTQPQADLDRLTEREIDKLVLRYVKSAGESEEYWQVSHLGERAIPSLLKVLADPKNQIRPSGDDAPFFAKSGVERALAILGRFDLPEIVPFLEKMASHDDEHLRYATAVDLAKYPSSSKLPVISKLMHDMEEHVRSGVFIGLMHAIRENRLTPEVRQALATELAAIVTKETDYIISDAHPAALLLSLDLHMATELLTTPEVLNTTNPGAAQIIDLLSLKGISIPDDLLNKLLTATDRADFDYRIAKLRGELLKAMAGMGHPDAESLILRTLAQKASETSVKERETLRELASEALCVVRGIRDPIDRAFQRDGDAHGGGKPLEKPALNVLVVADLNAEILNGGFDQYFFNSSGDHATKAVSALQEIGAPKHAEVARAAVELFGSQGPSSQREERFRQRESMSEAQAAKLSALDQAWYDADANLHILLHLYSAAHADSFK